MRKRAYASSWLILLLLTSCTPRHLNCRLEYLSKKSLASFHVSTPDPHLNYPPIGQQLITTWWINEPCPILRITVRFQNEEEIVYTYDNLNSKGTVTTKNLNNDYLNRGCIQTYKAELLLGDTVITTFTHQLFKNLITISP